MFPGSDARIDYWECGSMSGHVVKWRWRPISWKRWEIVYISARIHDSNEIPTAMPMFAEFS